jgi:hypothetical protein
MLKYDSMEWDLYGEACHVGRIMATRNRLWDVEEYTKARRAG